MNYKQIIFYFIFVPILLILYINLQAAEYSIIDSVQNLNERMKNDSNKKTEIVPLDYTQNSTENNSSFDTENLLFIKNLRNYILDDSSLTIEEQLTNGINYEQYIASYTSDSFKIYGLLTIPTSEPPQDGYPAIIFNHGYIPPAQYKTTEKYVDYVDYIARNGYVVFKIDFRGHGNSEGEPRGAYFSSNFAIDTLNALKAVQKFDKVNPDKIGIWGHSMSGNVTLKSILANSDFKVGVIWAGAGYSFKDLAKYGLNDTSYIGRRPENDLQENLPLRDRVINVIENSNYWQYASLTENLEYLDSPLQIHHAEDDGVVNIGYSRDLVEALIQNGKIYEFYEYQSGGHNINGQSFTLAMKRTVEFFDRYLK